MIIKLPKYIKSDFKGYEDLTSIYHQINKSQETEIRLDFTENKWFDANLCAVLGAIVFFFEDTCYKKIDLEVNDELSSLFGRNGYIQYDGIKKDPRYETVISYSTFTHIHDEQFIQYIRRELLAKNDFPKHTSNLGKLITENIYELFDNARTHGVCNYIHTCGQYFPNDSPKRMDITIVDIGNTFKENVTNYLKLPISGKDAIRWAVIEGNTTKIGDIPGGLGLFRILDFIALNKGKMQVVSANGFWEHQVNKEFDLELSQAFPGTIVNLEFNLDDNSIYSLKGESIENIIF